MNGVFKFFSYNNAVPIAISVLILGGGSVFAATNPEAILSQQQTVMSVDNTYIATKDLSAWSPVVNITAVTEDNDNYYVAYKFSTIDVKDYVWQDVVKNNSITVSKADLGDHDLGLYVTDLLNNIVHNESTYLAQVQQKEKANITQKMVATAYGGLIGKFLNDSTETLPGYEPVIPLPVAAPADPAAPLAVAAPVPELPPSPPSPPSPQPPINEQIDTLLAQSQAASSTAATLGTATSTSDSAATSSPVVVATTTPATGTDATTTAATSTDPAPVQDIATSSAPVATPTPPAADTGATSTAPSTAPTAPADAPPADPTPAPSNTAPPADTSASTTPSN